MDIRKYLDFVVALLFLALTFAGSLALESPAKEIFIKENGLVETCTVAFYALCLFWMHRQGRMAYIRAHYYFYALIVFFALRELDFDKRFTTMGIFKSKFYLSPDVSLLEKSLALAVILFIAYCVWLAIRRHATTWLGGLRRGSKPAIAVLLALVFMVVSKSLDGLARKLHDFGVDISEHASDIASALEEVLELGIPIVLFLALFHHFRQAASARNS